jgi:hypothetical protein
MRTGLKRMAPAGKNNDEAITEREGQEVWSC